MKFRYLLTIAMAGVFILSFPAINSTLYSDNTESILEQIDEGLVRYYLTELLKFAPRYTGSDACREAEEWAYNEFSSMGLNVEYFEWAMGSFEDRNVIATLPGDEYIIIVGAHIDTVEDAPGADDDGSGVAAVLSVAKVLSRYSFSHTIKFIIYSGEEVGTYGSYAHAKYSYENGDKILAVLDVDMVGYANSSIGGKYIRFFQPERSKWITDFSADTVEKYYDLVGLNVESVPNYPGADHQAYVDYGYDAIFMAHYDGYPYGHSPEDSLDKINFTYEMKAARFLACIVNELANKPVNPYVQIIEPKEGYLYVFNRPIMQIVSKNWYNRLRGITVVIGRVDVIAEVNGDVEKVIFAIDDRMWRWDYSPPYEWKINVFLLGRHLLKVYAYGNEIVKDEMDLIAFIPYVP